MATYLLPSQCPQSGRNQSSYIASAFSRSLGHGAVKVLSWGPRSGVEAKWLCHLAVPRAGRNQNGYSLCLLKVLVWTGIKVVT